MKKLALIIVFSFLYLNVGFSKDFLTELSLLNKALKLVEKDPSKAKTLIKQVISYNDPITKSDALVVYAYLSKDSDNLKNILDKVDTHRLTRGFVYEYYRLLARVDKSIISQKPCFFQDKKNELMGNELAIKNALKGGCYYFAYVISQNSNSKYAIMARFYHYLFTNDFNKANEELLNLKPYLIYQKLKDFYANYIYRYLFFKDEPRALIDYAKYVPDSFYKYFYEGISYFELGDYKDASVSFEKASYYDKTGASYYWLYKITKDKKYLEKASNYDSFYGTLAKLKLHKPIYAKFLRCPSYKPDRKVKEFKEIMDYGFNSYLYSYYKDKSFTKKEMCEIFHINPKFFMIRKRLWNAYPVVFLEDIPKDTVSPNLVLSIIRMESFYNPIARTYWAFPDKKSTTVGLMQVKDTTGMFVAKRFNLPFVDDMKNPKYSILYGSYYLYYVYSLWNKNLVKAIASYNAGPGNVSRYKDFDDWLLFVEHIPNTINRHYVKNVLNFYWHYKYALAR
ncbi:MAG: transglycosylase SLT domain-containing protein [Hydrogenobaculum sp.]